MQLLMPLLGLLGRSTAYIPMLMGLQEREAKDVVGGGDTGKQRNRDEKDGQQPAPPAEVGAMAFRNGKQRQPGCCQEKPHQIQNEVS